jgi:hypothetical protein
MSGYSISVQQIGNKTKIEINGTVSDEQLREIKEQYEDAEIFLNGKRIGGRPKIVELETRRLK